MIASEAIVGVGIRDKIKVQRRRERGVMGHVSNWLHDHNWDGVNNQKTDWRLFLIITLVAMAAYVLIMLMFPGSTH